MPTSIGLYLKLGALAAVLTLVGWLYYSKVTLEGKVTEDTTLLNEANSKLQTALADNEGLAKSVTLLQAQAQKTADQLRQREDSLNASQAKLDSIRTQLANLEKTDAAYHSWSLTPIPASVDSLLLAATTPTSAGNQDGGSEAANPRPVDAGAPVSSVGARTNQ